MPPARLVAVLVGAALAVAGGPAHAAPRYDVLRDATRRVHPALGYGQNTAVSANGRYVAYIAFTEADPAKTETALYGGHGTPQVALYDRVTRRVEIVSRSATSALGDAESKDVSMSADGRYVLFSSNAANLAVTPADRNGGWDVFLYDRTTRKLSRVNVEATRGREIGTAERAVLSRDGSTVLFYGVGKYQGESGTASQDGLYVYQRAKKRLVPLKGSDGRMLTIGSGTLPAISGDGKRIGREDYSRDVYEVREVATGRIWTVPSGNAGALDAKGQRVVVQVPVYGAGTDGFVVADLVAGTVTSGELLAPTVRVLDVAISDDGRTIAVTGWAAGDTALSSPARRGVLLIDAKSGALTPVGPVTATGCSGASCAFGYLGRAAIASRQAVAFSTQRPLATSDSGDSSDVYFYAE
ncbi:MAG: hypothetical protein QOE45_2344 [Frankiaceae bacterium]|jgi:hypothetical protein|nr:hypothetical protein [Frankiaceae bacterium]